MSGRHRGSAPVRSVLPLYRLLPVVEPAWSWGMLLPARGDGRCFRCRLPWWALRVNRERAPEWVLCPACWTKSDVFARVQAHKWLMSRGCYSAAEVDAVLAQVAAISREAL